MFLYPVISASGTTVTAPATLPGGLNKETSDEMQKIVDEMEADLRNDVGDVDQVAAGIYSNGDPQKLVVLVAATSTILFPDDEIEDAFKGFNADRSGSSVGGQTSYPAGDLGGTVKCGERHRGRPADDPVRLGGPRQRRHRASSSAATSRSPRTCSCRSVPPSRAADSPVSQVYEWGRAALGPAPLRVRGPCYAAPMVDLPGISDDAFDDG